VLQFGDITNNGHLVHQKWWFSKIASHRGNLWIAVEMQNWMKCGKKIWSGMAGSVTIPCDVIARQVGPSNCATILSSPWA
jgi:hypothetical protein